MADKTTPEEIEKASMKFRAFVFLGRWTATLYVPLTWPPNYYDPSKLVQFRSVGETLYAAMNECWKKYLGWVAAGRPPVPSPLVEGYDEPDEEKPE